MKTSAMETNQAKTDIAANIKTLLLLPALCILAAAIGFLTPDDLKPALIANLAWGVSLFVLITLAVYIYQSYGKGVSRNTVTRNIPLLLVSALFILVFERVDHRANKVILDELVLQTSALQLLENNEYGVPRFSHNLTSEFSIHSHLPDKRPPFHPSILSLTHRLLGYSQVNGFLLNGILGIATLFCLGKSGEIIFPKYGGYISILLFCTLPLFSQNVTSQHWEILYLFLISFLFLTTTRIIISKLFSEIHLCYLLALAIALTRYEGLIFLSVPFLLHSYILWSGHFIKISKVVQLCSLVGISYLFVLITNVFNGPEFWQLEDLKNAQPFGPIYWQQNVSAFLEVMFNSNRSFPTSMPLSLIGLTSLLVALFSMVNVLSKKSASGIEFRKAYSLLLLIIPMVLFLGLIFSYHWGFVNSHLTFRFLLFPYFVFTISIVYLLEKNGAALALASFGLVCAWTITGSIFGVLSINNSIALLLAGTGALFLTTQLPKSRKHLPTVLITFLSIYIVTETLPSVAQRQYERDYFPIPRTKIFYEWIQRYAGTNSMFIAESPLYGMLHRESATSIERFNDNPQNVWSLAATGKFENVFVMQEVGMDDSGALHPFKKYELNNSVSTETVETRRIVGDFGVRLLRVIKVESPPQTISSQEQ